MLHRHTPIAIAALALLLALPISVPAPISERDLGIRPGMTPEQERMVVQEYERQDLASHLHSARGLIERAEDVRETRASLVGETRAVLTVEAPPSAMPVDMDTARRRLWFLTVIAAGLLMLLIISSRRRTGEGRIS